MREVKIALVAGLALLVIGIGVALARSPTTVARKNGMPSEELRIASTLKSASYCQAGELLPRGTSAIRLWWFSFAGPRVHVAVYSDGRTITSGEQGSGWTSREVTVPVTPLPADVADVTVCGSFQLHDEELTVFGGEASPADETRNGREVLPGRMWIEYLHPGTRTWASLVPSILSRMGFGRAASGIGIVLLALALLATVVVLASRLVLRELS